RGLGVAGGGIREERGEDRQRLPLPALEAPARCGYLSSSAHVTYLERRPELSQPVLVLAVAGDLEPGVWMPRPDKRPGGYQEIDALGDDQLADVNDSSKVAGQDPRPKPLRIHAGRPQA